MKVKFSLGIGISNARQEECFDVEKDLGANLSVLKGESLELFLEDCWRDWSQDFIDGGIKIEDE